MAKRRTRKARRQRGGDPRDMEGLPFPKDLAVTLTGGIRASGALVRKNATKAEPTVAWDATPGVYRTVLCVDPDSKAKSWLHWMVVNCTGADPNSGETVVDWTPPSPPTGIHRYYFCLFQHRYKINAMEARPAQRGFFSAMAFMEKHGLQPDALAMFQASASPK